MPAGVAQLSRDVVRIIQKHEHTLCFAFTSGPQRGQRVPNHAWNRILHLFSVLFLTGTPDRLDNELLRWTRVRSDVMALPGFKGRHVLSCAVARFVFISQMLQDLIHKWIRSDKINGLPWPRQRMRNISNSVSNRTPSPTRIEPVSWINRTDFGILETYYGPLWSEIRSFSYSLAWER